MRWFVVFLLLANLALYLWMAHGESPRPAHELPPPDIGRLRLLHEAESAALAELSARSELPTATSSNDKRLPATDSDEVFATDGEAAGEPGGVVEQATLAGPMLEDQNAGQPRAAVEFPVDSTVESASVSGVAAATPEQDAWDNAVEVAAAGTTAVASGAMATSVEQPAAQAEDPSEAPSALMPRESASPAAGPTDSEESTEASETNVNVLAANRCLRVGPLTREQAQDLRAKLNSSTRVVDEERRETSAVDGYYVLIPPLASRQEGNAKLDELSAAGVKDTWLFRAGELRNAISLGYFKREASALRHAENIRGLGFDAEVREKAVQVEGVWLLVSPEPGLGAAGLTDVTPEGASTEQVDCPAR